MSHPKEVVTTGKGMPDKTPSAGQQRPGKQTTPKDASDEASLAMPHERDQQTDMTAGEHSPVVKQGARDVERGLKDTSKQPEMGRAYDKQK